MTEWGWVSREGDKQASLRISEGKFEGVVYQYGKVVLPDPMKNMQKGTCHLGLSIVYLIMQISIKKILERTSSKLSGIF